MVSENHQPEDPRLQKDAFYRMQPRALLLQFINKHLSFLDFVSRSWPRGSRPEAMPAHARTEGWQQSQCRAQTRRRCWQTPRQRMWRPCALERLLGAVSARSAATNPNPGSKVNSVLGKEAAGVEVRTRAARATQAPRGAAP